MNELETLKKIVKEQDIQLKALKQAINILTKRGADTDARARRNSESCRRVTNDINTIKGKLRS